MKTLTDFLKESMDLNMQWGVRSENIYAKEFHTAYKAGLLKFLGLNISDVQKVKCSHTDASDKRPITMQNFTDYPNIGKKIQDFKITVTMNDGKKKDYYISFKAIFKPGNFTAFRTTNITSCFDNKNIGAPNKEGMEIIKYLGLDVDNIFTNHFNHLPKTISDINITDSKILSNIDSIIKESVGCGYIFAVKFGAYHTGVRYSDFTDSRNVEERIGKLNSAEYVVSDNETKYVGIRADYDNIEFLLRIRQRGSDIVFDVTFKPKQDRLDYLFC